MKLCFLSFVCFSHWRERTEEKNKEKKTNQKSKYDAHAYTILNWCDEERKQNIINTTETVDVLIGVSIVIFHLIVCELLQMILSTRQLYTEYYTVRNQFHSIPPLNSQLWTILPLLL